jgi:hypothetical protein
MNLNYDPTEAALLSLISTTDSSMDIHNLAIDYDGEVIIDPEIHYPGVAVDRYRFCAHVRDASLRNIDMVKALCYSLLKVFETEVYYMDTDRNDPLTAAA